MAESKKKYKKKSEDKFISYILIGFSVAFFVIILSVVLFNLISNPLDYGSFDSIEDGALITTQSESEYLVYYYTEDCFYCKEIKQQVLEFANENNEGVKVYFMDGVNVNGSLYVNGLTGTPAFITIVNGQIVDLVGGAVDIPAAFDEINDGSYLYFN